MLLAFENVYAYVHIYKCICVMLLKYFWNYSFNLLYSHGYLLFSFIILWSIFSTLVPLASCFESQFMVNKYPLFIHCFKKMFYIDTCYFKTCFPPSFPRVSLCAHVCTHTCVSLKSRSHLLLLLSCILLDMA